MYMYIYVCLYVKYPIFFWEFRKTGSFCTFFYKVLKFIFFKVRPLGVELLDTDGRTDITNVILAFRKCSKCLVWFTLSYMYNICTVQTYVGWNWGGSAWEWRNGRSQLLWRSIAQSIYLQKWHKWMLLCAEIRYNLNTGITFCEAGRDCKTLTYTIPNSAVPYCEEYCSRILLVVWLMCECLLKDGCVLLINWEKW